MKLTILMKEIKLKKHTKVCAHIHTRQQNIANTLKTTLSGDD